MPFETLPSLWHVLWLGPVLFFLWAYIHEMAHILAAKWLVGVEWYELKLYPHKYEGNWRWAGVRYMLADFPTKKEQSLISLAPRIPDLLAIVLLPLGPLFFSGWLLLLWSALWTAGLFDLVTGSLALTKSSDHRRALSKPFQWVFRVGGLALVVLSTVGWLFSVGLF